VEPHVYQNVWFLALGLVAVFLAALGVIRRREGALLFIRSFNEERRG